MEGRILKVDYLVQVCSPTVNVSSKFKHPYPWSRNSQHTSTLISSIRLGPTDEALDDEDVLAGVFRLGPARLLPSFRGEPRFEMEFELVASSSRLLSAFFPFNEDADVIRDVPTDEFVRLAAGGGGAALCRRVTTIVPNQERTSNFMIFLKFGGLELL